jgi:hypothetical protein
MKSQSLRDALILFICPTRALSTCIQWLPALISMRFHGPSFNVLVHRHSLRSYICCTYILKHGIHLIEIGYFALLTCFMFSMRWWWVVVLCGCFTAYRTCVATIYAIRTFHDVHIRLIDRVITQSKYHAQFRPLTCRIYHVLRRIRENDTMTYETMYAKRMITKLETIDYGSAMYNA